MNKKQRIHILACGGTIACKSNGPFDEFYHSPVSGIRDLVSNIRDVADLADVSSEEVFQKLSHEMVLDDLILLAKKINEVITLPEIDGIVITHGTNAIEEASYFINLVVNTEKPIIFTGAMRPGNAIGADGLKNLRNAILLASSGKSKKIGVILTFNDEILSARNAIKLNPCLLNAFGGNEFSLLGRIQGDEIVLLNQPAYKHTFSSEFHINNILELPQVPVIFGGLGTDELLVRAILEEQSGKIKGIISAGMGKGYQSKETTGALVQASEKGIVVVRCSRTGYGIINPDVDYDLKKGFLTGGSLPPQKARIVLSVALTKTNDRKKIQLIFNNY